MIVNNKIPDENAYRNLMGRVKILVYLAMTLIFVWMYTKGITPKYLLIIYLATMLMFEIIFRIFSPLGQKLFEMRRMALINHDEKVLRKSNFIYGLIGFLGFLAHRGEYYLHQHEYTQPRPVAVKIQPVLPVTSLSRAPAAK